jgi:hypothetical protein
MKDKLWMSPCGKDTRRHRCILDLAGPPPISTLQECMRWRASPRSHSMVVRPPISGRAPARGLTMMPSPFLDPLRHFARSTIAVAHRPLVVSSRCGAGEPIAVLFARKCCATVISRSKRLLMIGLRSQPRCEKGNLGPGPGHGLVREGALCVSGPWACDSLWADLVVWILIFLLFSAYMSKAQ